MLTVEQAKNELRAYRDACEATLCNLYERWLDESEYEDIADYRAAFERNCPSSVFRITGFRKRPFGPVFQFADGSFPGATFSVNVNLQGIQWQKLPSKPSKAAPVKSTFTHAIICGDTVLRPFRDIAAAQAALRLCDASCSVARIHYVSDATHAAGCRPVIDGAV